MEYGTPERDGILKRVTIIPAPTAKGLEFDAVVVVEPSAIHTDERGGRLLYIALTRAVQALAIVHADPLPAALAA
jgi:DNA helicase IV